MTLPLMTHEKWCFPRLSRSVISTRSSEANTGSVDRLYDKHPDMLTSMANLASTHKNQGRWKMTEELDVQVRKTGISTC
jgi:hypothetical protein